MEKDWEWLDKEEPEKLYIVKTKDLRVSNLSQGFTREDVLAWLKTEEKGYNERCIRRSGEQKHFTFRSFEDMVDFVETEGYIPGFIRAIIEKDGEMLVAHGRHRWAAAYLCGIKEVQCRLCKKI